MAGAGALPSPALWPGLHGSRGGAVIVERVDVLSGGRSPRPKQTTVSRVRGVTLVPLH